MCFSKLISKHSPNLIEREYEYPLFYGITTYCKPLYQSWGTQYHIKYPRYSKLLMFFINQVAIIYNIYINMYIQYISIHIYIYSIHIRYILYIYICIHPVFHDAPASPRHSFLRSLKLSRPNSALMYGLSLPSLASGVG